MSDEKYWKDYCKAGSIKQAHELDKTKKVNGRSFLAGDFHVRWRGEDGEWIEQGYRREPFLALYREIVRAPIAKLSDRDAKLVELKEIREVIERMFGRIVEGVDNIATDQAQLRALVERMSGQGAQK